MPDPLQDFKRFLNEFRTLSVWTFGGAMAIPFAAQLTDLSPPWPPGIVGITATIELLSLVFVFQFLKTAPRRKINRKLISGAVALFFSASVYLILFSLFTYTTPVKKERYVKGFVCTEVAATVYKNACPILGMDALKDSHWDAEEFWTLPSIVAVRMVLSGSWLLSFLSLSVILGSFLVFQMRVGSRGAPEIGNVAQVARDFEKELPQPSSPAKKTVYLSYAWRSDSNEIADGLRRVVESEGFDFVRDKDNMKPGDRISDFMKDIAKADVIIVVLSSKYLRSVYCMRELYGIYRHSDAEQDEFLNRVIPLTLADAAYSTWDERLAHAQYWRSEYKRMEKSLTNLGGQDMLLYRSMKDWQNSVGDMLAFVSDKLHPHSLEESTKDDYQAVRVMLRAKRDGSFEAHA